MKKYRICLLLLLLVTPLHSGAQHRAFNQAELDALLAPVALYPDSLLTQILVAATYPRQVVEAARWSRANRQLSGDEAVRAAQPNGWHPAVASLAAFPDVLARMDESPQWLRDLGEAYLAYEPYVMDIVQQLRRRAEANGNLRSDEQRQVYRQNEIIVVQPVHPQIVYVPYYNPLIVFGPWWWPVYPPVYWRPWFSRPVPFYWQAWHNRYHRQRHVQDVARPQPPSPSVSMPSARPSPNGAPSVAAQMQAAETAKYIERQRAANNPAPATHIQHRAAQMPPPATFSQRRPEHRENNRSEARQHMKERRG